MSFKITKQQRNIAIAFFSGVVATLGVTAIVHRVRRGKWSGFLGMGEDLNPLGAQDVMTFTMTNNTTSPQKITLFNGYSPTPNTNPNISLTSTPSIQFFTQTLGQQPLELDRMQIRCRKLSSFSGVIPPAPAPKPAAPKPVAPAPPKPAAPLAPPPPPASSGNCEQQLNQPLTIDYKDASGEEQSVPVMPQISAYQAQNMAVADLRGVVLDNQTVIRDYTVMPKTTVIMTIFWKEPKNKYPRLPKK